MTDQSLFPEDRRVRCHVCSVMSEPDEIHTGHAEDCAGATTGLCRCDLPVCAVCCTDPACVGVAR